MQKINLYCNTNYDEFLLVVDKSSIPIILTISNKEQQGTIILLYRNQLQSMRNNKNHTIKTNN